MENFRVVKLEEWGVGYETLRSENPELIYCSLSGYGEWGPDRDRPAYDIIMQAEGGLMSITGDEDGAPVRVGVAIADIGAGMYGTQAITAALFERERSQDGAGQKIDISLLDGQAAWMAYMASNYFATGDSPRRMGSKHPTIAPYQAFETRDGYVVVACASKHIWPRFCTALGRSDLIDEPQYTTNADRVRNRDALDTELDSVFADLTTSEALGTLRAHDVPASEVNDMATVFDKPQLTAQGMEQSTNHPIAGDVRMLGSPIHFSRAPSSIHRHPPLLGEHTEKVLGELGYTSEEIDQLATHDVI